jgi:molybdopterin-synthase adenylyltransferase
MSHSVAIPTALAQELSAHLFPGDGEEDLCFGVYFLSHGERRESALLNEWLVPRHGERHRHGNASFEGEYLLRAVARARAEAGGVFFCHSHPRGRGWQGMSEDDIEAESGLAPRIGAATGLPLLGLTLAEDGTWSARSWPRGERREAESVRVVGGRLALSFNPALRPPPEAPESQRRSLSAWGEEVQADLARLRVGIVGAGSVGAIVGEILARSGVGEIVLLDFDRVEPHNLDRLLHAYREDAEAHRLKVDVLAAALRRSATAPDFEVRALPHSVVEPEGFAAALDCDLLFSCVDRPWPRAALNLAAYAHLVPVVDGGIAIYSPGGRMRRADYRAHLVGPGRRCLECLGQYDPGLVQTERAGLLADPAYVAGLPNEHPLRRSENVFAFSAATAAAEVLQVVSALVAPSGIADVGAQLYHAANGRLDVDLRPCEGRCLYAGRFLARGESAGIEVTARHHAAERARAEAGRPEASA